MASRVPEIHGAGVENMNIACRDERHTHFQMTGSKEYYFEVFMIDLWSAKWFLPSSLLLSPIC